MRATIAPIWVGGEFIPAKGRLIGGGSALLLGMELVRKLSLTVGFGKRYFHVAQGEWHVAVRNCECRWVYPLAPTARGCAKLAAYFSKIINFEVEVSEVDAYCDTGCEVKRCQIRNMIGGECGISRCEVRLGGRKAR